MAFCDMPQKSQKQLTNISLRQFVALSGKFDVSPYLNKSVVKDAETGEFQQRQRQTTVACYKSSGSIQEAK